MATYSFSEVKFKGIDGEILDESDENRPVYKVLGEFLYVQASGKNLGLVKIGSKIYDGGEVEIDREDAVVIRDMLLEDKAPFAAFVKLELTEYINSVLKPKEEKT